MNTNAIISLLVLSNFVFLSTNTVKRNTVHDEYGAIVAVVQAYQFRTNLYHYETFYTNETRLYPPYYMDGPFFWTNVVEVQRTLPIYPPAPLPLTHMNRPDIPMLNSLLTTNK